MNLKSLHLKSKLVALIAASFVFFNFICILGFDYVHFDDPEMVFENPQVMQGLTWDTVKWAFYASDLGLWHPVTWLSHQLDVELFGLDSGGWHHLQNLLAVSLSAFFFSRILSHIFPEAFPWLVLLVTLAVFLHPTRAENVAWISQRKDSLATLFILLSWWSFLNIENGSYARRWAIISLISAVLALFSKPTACVLPVLLFISTSRFRPSVRQWQIIAPTFVFASLVAIVTVLSQTSSSQADTINSLEWSHRFGAAAQALTIYLRSTVIPIPSSIHQYYTNAFWTWWAIGGMLIFAGLTIVFFLQRKCRSLSWIGWLVTILFLLPVIGLIPTGVIFADRYLLLPHLGLAIILLSTFGRKLYATYILAPLVLFSILGLQTQLSSWKNSKSLFERELSHHPNNYLPLVNYAAWLAEEKAPEPEIQALLRRACQHDGSALAWFSLGQSFEREGLVREAISAYDEAIKQRPLNPRSHLRLAHLLIQDPLTAKPEKALRILTEAEASFPNSKLVIKFRSKLSELLSRE